MLSGRHLVQHKKLQKIHHFFGGRVCFLDEKTGYFLKAFIQLGPRFF